MNKYDEYSKMFEELRSISKRYNVTFITASQPPRPYNPTHANIKEHIGPEVIILDHISKV